MADTATPKEQMLKFRDVMGVEAKRWAEIVDQRRQELDNAQMYFEQATRAHDAICGALKGLSDPDDPQIVPYQDEGRSDS